MDIRKACIADASCLAALSIEVWVGTYLRNGVSKFFADYALSEFTTNRFEALIEQERDVTLVSENTGGIDGYIRIAFDSEAAVPTNSTTEIKTFYVQPRHQGKGIGKRLLEEAYRLCAAKGSGSAWLTVNSENRTAIDFYIAQGFSKIGETVFTIDGESYPNEVMLKEF
ncbi:GNAT family N-acetyltransferase [Agrobacterium larrymoorei]|uniref:GNAT family N-acetyltransferase n=1 Tax=Agrobacterium larrymoorei TaxID=160699 RepID=A0A4D7DNH2_9HYPH|nr:GNAT family N-acetyltransferase [Agrobacterium larrymoorei]QCI97184.1 GNAT family N-acetyltransferase [Agrobacterium larrymoorei]QYA07384.1 GNAT family N-acetyltransferase [Agrobacterium larrymoorei]